MARILKNKYFYLLAILFFILFLINNLVLTNTGHIKKCNNLNFQQANILHPNNFSAFQINIKFLNEKKWHSNQLKNRKSYINNGYYLNKYKNKAEIIISIPKKLKCSLSVNIKPHGDLEDHHIPFNLLPSLQVKIKDGHIYGITNFILFRPKTRISINSEIFATTIIKEIGLLAPRTTRVNIKHNDEKQSFIFQEKIVKEFIEINNFKEGEIISFDDRFNYSNNINAINTSQYKLVNTQWAKKNNILRYNNNLEVLNSVRNKHKYDIGGPDDLYSTAKILNLDFMFEQLPKFAAIMTAMNAEHGLSIDDRKFYYNSFSKNYLPIYYDGMATFYSDNEINRPVLYSSIIGANDAFISFEKINKNKFIKKLQVLGVDNTKEEIKIILKKIEKNLIELKNHKENPISNMAQIRNNNKRLNTLSYLFKGSRSSEYEICDESFTNCYFSELESELNYELISQKLKIKDKDIIFISSIKSDFLNNLWANKLKENINNQNNSLFENNKNKFLLVIYGDVDIDFNDELNELSITKNNIKSRVLLLNGKIDDFTINFTDNTNLKTNTDDFQNITGCVTFYNMKLANLNLNLKNSKCEDALNIIRSQGSIDNINIEDSIADGIDLDFSEISINNLIVKNSLDDCLDVSFGQYNIENIYLYGCLDKGISSEYSKIKLQNIIITASNMALVSKDYSIIEVNKAIISKSKYCVNAYNKKQEFSGGEVKIMKMKCNKGLINKDHMSLISIKD